MWTRLIKGDGMRKSRLHNYNGQFLDAAGFFYLPQSILTAILLKLTHRRPELPWLGFRAIKHLDEIINKNWNVLEFGSGMSTIWLSRRCKSLVSIETDKVWHDTVRRILNEKEIGNVDYRFSSGPEEEALHDFEESSFDLVIVDGHRRDRVMATAISKVKRGGYIYLDNSDVPYQEYRTAKAMLINAAGEESGIRVFNDLYPTQVCVNEGILATVMNKPE